MPSYTTKLKSLVIFSSFIITTYALQACSEGNCAIYPSGGEDVVCTNTAETCIIYCDNDSDCAGSNIYMAAQQINSLTCSAPNACNQAQIYCGIPPDYATHNFVSLGSGKFGIDELSGHIDSCSFFFSNDATADYPTNVNCFYDIDACTLSANSGSDSFVNANFYCELGPEDAYCRMTTDSNNQQLSTFECKAEQCQCNEGNGRDECVNLLSVIVATAPPTTSAPTSAPTTETPTEQPTSSPTATPTKVPTTTTTTTESPTAYPTKPPSTSPTGSPVPQTPSTDDTPKLTTPPKTKTTKTTDNDHEEHPAIEATSTTTAATTTNTASGSPKTVYESSDMMLIIIIIGCIAIPLSCAMCLVGAWFYWFCRNNKNERDNKKKEEEKVLNMMDSNKDGEFEDDERINNISKLNVNIEMQNIQNIQNIHQHQQSPLELNDDASSPTPETPGLPPPPRRKPGHTDPKAAAPGTDVKVNVIANAKNNMNNAGREGSGDNLNVNMNMNMNINLNVNDNDNEICQKPFIVDSDDAEHHKGSDDVDADTAQLYLTPHTYDDDEQENEHILQEENENDDNNSFIVVGSPSPHQTRGAIGEKDDL